MDRTEPAPAILLFAHQPDRLNTVASILASLSAQVVVVENESEALERLLDEVFASAVVEGTATEPEHIKRTCRLLRSVASESTPIILIVERQSAAALVMDDQELMGVTFVFSPVISAVLRAEAKLCLNRFEATSTSERQAKKIRTLEAREKERKKLEEREWLERQREQGWGHERDQQLERERASAKLLAFKNAALLRANEELDQFARVVSHDLKDPLAVVAAYLELIQRRHVDTLNPEAKEFIEYAMDGAVRMQQLIQDLLAFCRLNTRSAAFARTSCAEAVERAMDNLRLEIADSRAQISIDPLPEIVAESSQLIRLFQNLVGNAIKFCAAQMPQIHITANRSVDSSGDDEWIFSVRDNGIGISERNLKRIFQVFKRLHTSEEYPGTGIGLAICKKIVEHHGGNLWVESTVGQGTTFFFSLPAEPDRQPSDSSLGL